MKVNTLVVAFVSIDPRKSQCSGSNAPITTQSGALTRGNNHLRRCTDASDAPYRPLLVIDIDGYLLFQGPTSMPCFINGVDC